jgi:hypothetical protein
VVRFRDFIFVTELGKAEEASTISGLCSRCKRVINCFKGRFNEVRWEGRNHLQVERKGVRGLPVADLVCCCDMGMEGVVDDPMAYLRPTGVIL